MSRAIIEERIEFWQNEYHMANDLWAHWARHANDSKRCGTKLGKARAVTQLEELQERRRNARDMVVKYRKELETYVEF